ncbi:MAG: hypothetical protein NZ870_03685 [bacterium]|nr:hypothetical protein [bacterium]
MKTLLVFIIGLLVASTSQNVQVRVTVTATLSVSVDTGAITFGSLGTGVTQVASSSVTVTNTSTSATERFLLRHSSLTSPSNWVAVIGTPGQDQIRIDGIFRNSQPSSADFTSNDVITASDVAASSTQFARDADADSEKGFNVAPGGKRGLWFRLTTPTSLSTGSGVEQNINITITASF